MSVRSAVLVESIGKGSIGIQREPPEVTLNNVCENTCYKLSPETVPQGTAR